MKTHSFRIILFLTVFSTGFFSLSQAEEKKQTKEAGLTRAQRIAEAQSSVKPDVAQLQSQIETILQMNETVKPVYQGNAVEMQKISEQALIHQRILKSLDTQRTASVPQSSDIDEVIRLEKIRLIQEQTLHNRQAVLNLTDKTPAISAVLPSQNTKPVPTVYPSSGLQENSKK
jgi:hypothetical protein